MAGTDLQNLPNLLNRAAAALETPDDLTDDERGHVIEDLVAAAAVLAATDYELGRAAHAAGLPNAPALDATLMARLDGIPVGGGGMAIMRAWQRGWLDADLTAFAGDPDGYRRARGAVRGTEPAEDVIRRDRDGEP